MSETLISKLLSPVLRHHPEKLGLTPGPHGWADALLGQTDGTARGAEYRLV